MKRIKILFLFTFVAMLSSCSMQKPLVKMDGKYNNKYALITKSVKPL